MFFKLRCFEGNAGLRSKSFRNVEIVLYGKTLFAGKYGRANPKNLNLFTILVCPIQISIFTFLNNLSILFQMQRQCKAERERWIMMNTKYLEGGGFALFAKYRPAIRLELLTEMLVT